MTLQSSEHVEIEKDFKESRGYTVCGASPYLHLYISPSLPLSMLPGSGVGGQNT
jgi:hypothetical protein